MIAWCSSCRAGVPLGRPMDWGSSWGSRVSARDSASWPTATAVCDRRISFDWASVCSWRRCEACVSNHAVCLAAGSATDWQYAIDLTYFPLTCLIPATMSLDSRRDWSCRSSDTSPRSHGCWPLAATCRISRNSCSRAMILAVGAASAWTIGRNDWELPLRVNKCQLPSVKGFIVLF